VNDLEAPSMPSQEELDSLDDIPRDNDKEMHDHHMHTLVCECMTFILAYIPHRDPLRLAFVQRYEPTRLETPRWVDAWEELDNDECCTDALIDLDAVSSKMKKVCVFRNRPVEDNDGSTLYTLRWSTIHAQSGIFHADSEGDSESDAD
jgi:hypothetical protein